MTVFRAGIYHDSSALLSMFKDYCRVGTQYDFPFKSDDSFL